MGLYIVMDDCVQRELSAKKAVCKQCAKIGMLVCKDRNVTIVRA